MTSSFDVIMTSFDVIHNPSFISDDGREMMDGRCEMRSGDGMTITDNGKVILVVKLVRKIKKRNIACELRKPN